MSKDLKSQAKQFNYQRISFNNNWEVEMSLPARQIIQNAAYLARAEGMLLHARTLEARLPFVPRSAKYYVGRLKNGCATAYVRV